MLQDHPPDLKGDYSVLKRWYLHNLVLQLNPPRADLVEVFGYYDTLYKCEVRPSQVRPLPIHVAPFQI